MKNEDTKKRIINFGTSVKDISIILSRALKTEAKKEIRKIKNNPAPYIKGFLAGTFSVVMGTAISEADEPYTVVEYPQNNTIEIGISDLDTKLFSDKVSVKNENNKTLKKDLSDLVVTPFSFDESDIKKFNNLYQLSTLSPIIDPSNDKTILKLKESSYVIGEQAEDKDGYIKVKTTSGITGKILRKDLNYCMNLSDKKDKSKKTTSGKYNAVNGEIAGIDFSPFSIAEEKLEDVLDGSLHLTSIGNLNNPKSNFSYIRAASYLYGPGAHNHKLADIKLKRAKDEEDIISKCIDRINLCIDNDIPYGLYLYSTCINNEEAEEEARFFTKLLKSVQDETGALPHLPIAIDVELGQDGTDRQTLAYRRNKNSVSLAKAHLFNKLIEAYPELDYILYTSRNAAEVYNSKFFDIETVVDNIKSMDKMKVWWVSAMNLGPNANTLHAESAKKVVKDKEEKIEIVMKQIGMDVNVDPNYGNPLIDINVAKEEWITPYLDNFHEWKKAKEQETTTPENNTSTDALTNGYVTASPTALYDFKGKRISTLEGGTQLLGRGIPDKNGLVSVVTRDGKKGKVKLEYLSKVAKRENTVLSYPPDEKVPDDNDEMYL